MVLCQAVDLMAAQQAFEDCRVAVAAGQALSNGS